MSWKEVLKIDEIDMESSIRMARKYLDEIEGYASYYYGAGYSPDFDDEGDADIFQNQIYKDIETMNRLFKNPTKENLEKIEEMSNALYQDIEFEHSPLEVIPSFDIQYRE
tara:strand:+ start:15114 stop:15443 length:330 start_codon:yes stop_codon:yes gene_type:complete